MSEETGTRGKKALDLSVHTVVPLGIALIIGIFTALGIEGDSLTRLIRNESTWVLFALILAIVGVVVPLLARVFDKAWAGVAIALTSAILLIAATVAGLWGAVHGVGQREQPDVALAPQSAAEEVVVLKATASGISLGSHDHMLLRVVLHPASTKESAALGDCRNPASAAPTVEGSRLVYWGESGPSATGSTSAEIEFSVNRKEFGYVCALAVLSGKNSKPADFRFTSVLLDLRNVKQTATPSSTPIPMATPAQRQAD